MAVLGCSMLVTVMHNARLRQLSKPQVVMSVRPEGTPSLQGTALLNLQETWKSGGKVRPLRGLGRSYSQAGRPCR